MSREAIRGRVARFAYTLAQALFDRKLELDGVPVTFYYDTDVVLRMIMGFEYVPGGQPSSQEQNLVRALLSCGYLGKMHMLRPHAFELAENLRRPNSYSSPSDKELFRQKAREYLRDNGIGAVMAELRGIVGESCDRETKVENFVGFLRDKAGDTFVAIEKVSGSWLQRLRRYYDADAISFELLGPEMDELLEKEGGIVQEIVQTLRPERPSRYTLSLFNDAAALAVLYRFVRERELGQSERLVRFYTETKSIKHAFSVSQRLRDLLSYSSSTGGAQGIQNQSIIRDSAYFIMRAWFRELSPTSGDMRLDELEGLSSELFALLKSPEENLEKAMSNLAIEGRQLLQLMEGFERLAVLDSIWVRGRIPGYIADHFEEWTDVFDFANGAEAEENVFHQISDIREKLESKIHRIRTWTRDLEMILRAAETKRKQIRGMIEDPMRDLGLVRWGYNLSNEEQVDLVALISPLIQEPVEDVSIQAGELVNRLQRARYDFAPCGFACAALWALGRFREIVSLVEECGKGAIGGWGMPPSLLVIQSAAAMKSGDFVSRSQREEVVERVWTLMTNLTEEQRKGVLLGVGYVLYHAWKQENLGSTIHHTRKESFPHEVQAWAQMSFQAGEEASYLLPTGSLAWAFSINHCAYVGIVTGVEPEKTREYLDELTRLHGFPVWNNRFDDTLGVYYMLEAEGMLGLLREDWSRNQQDMEKLVGRAEDYFSRARERDFGDIDIDEHMSRLDRLKRSVRALDPGARALAC